MEVPHGFEKGVVRALGLAAAAANNPFFFFLFLHHPSLPTRVCTPVGCVPKVGQQCYAVGLCYGRGTPRPHKLVSGSWAVGEETV